MLRVIRTEIFKFYFDIKRYLFNYIVGIAATSIFLGGIYWATKSLFVEAGSEVAFMGLLLWLFASSALSDATEHLTEERYIGTLERISITKTPVVCILIARFIVNFLFTLCRAILIGGILYIIFQPKTGLLFSSWRVSTMALIIAVLTIIALYGFGLFMASLGLIFKRVGAISSILEYLVLFFSGIVIPWESMPSLLQSFSKVLPMTWGIRTLNNLQSGVNFWFCFANLIFYTLIITLIGSITFHYSMKFVKKKGEYSFY